MSDVQIESATHSHEGTVTAVPNCDSLCAGAPLIAMTSRIRLDQRWRPRGKQERP